MSPEVEQLLFSDPWYGLNNYTNYAHWQNLYYTSDPAKKQQQLAWLWELRSYFGLTFAQVEEMQLNWNTYYNNEATTVLLSFPSQNPYIS